MWAITVINLWTAITSSLITAMASGWLANKFFGNKVPSASESTVITVGIGALSFALLWTTLIALSTIMPLTAAMAVITGGTLFVGLFQESINIKALILGASLLAITGWIYAQGGIDSAINAVRVFFTRRPAPMAA